MARRISLGSYYAAVSPIHALDPRVKIAITLLYMVSCLIARGAPALALATLLALATCTLARIPLGRFARQLRPLAAVLVVTSLVNLLFADVGDVVAAWGPFAIRTAGIEAAVLYTVRFLLMFAMGSLLMLTTTPTAIADGLRGLLAPLERFGVPVGEAAMVVSIALRFVPTLARDARAITTAQTARGADLAGRGPIAYVRACIPLATPLFTGAMRHAENLGRAMDARGYTGSAERTCWHEPRLDSRRDGAAIAVAAICLVAILALSVIG